MTAFTALQVSEIGGGQFQAALVTRDTAELPEAEVLIRVRYSSLNYKDALSATGNRAVTRHYPHTPGIDAAGVVEASSAGEFVPGDEVIVTGYDLGMNTPGGFAQYIRVPAAWVIKRPQGLDLRAAMQLGTAGLTAALCIDKLERAGLEPGQGPVLVTGATGGVGTLAVALLARLGHEVVAATGKAGQADWLERVGARRVIGRQALQEGTGRALLEESWAGAVDCVGGDILMHVLKSLKRGASVACCGLTAGAQFQASVLPFILRGVNLLGVDSVEPPLMVKAAMWDRLSLQWRLDDLEALTHEVSLEQVPGEVSLILAGEQVGRALVRVD